MSTTTKDPRTSKKFAKIVAILGDEAKAVTAWNIKFPDRQIPVQTLAEVGFTKKQIAALEAAGNEKAEAETAPTTKELVDALVAKAGYTPTRGRVYTNKDLHLAQVRVLKTGKPEIVSLAEGRHTKAVVVWRTDDGLTTALHNLTVPN